MTKGIALSSQRLKLEVAFCIALGPALMATRGIGSREVEVTYSRAHRICQRLPKTPQLFQAVFGLLRYYLLRARFRTCQALVRELAECVARSRAADESLNYQFTKGTILLWTGSPKRAKQHFEKAIAACEAADQQAQCYTFGQSPLVISLAYLSFAQWLLGYPDCAASTAQEAVAEGRKLRHPFTLAFALFGASLVAQLRREAPLTLEYAEGCISVSESHHFPYFLAMSKILRAWGQAELSSGQGGADDIRGAIRSWASTGSRVISTYFLSLWASVLVRIGRPGEASKIVVRALRIAGKTGERWWEAELYRLLGEIRDLMGADRGVVEEYLEKAIGIAKAQYARALELRGLTSLARRALARDGGKKPGAALELVCHRFTEGHDTRDFCEAATVVSRLRTSPREVSARARAASPGRKEPSTLGKRGVS